MSRGPGRFQRKVLEAMATYHDLGSALQWEWCAGARYALSNYAMNSDISAYERGRRVHLWMLRRDLGCSRADLSRALTLLEQRGFVLRFDGSLGIVGDTFTTGRYAKFAGLTSEGEDYVKRQQRNSVRVGTYAAGGRAEE